jgi:hypothetical protein
LERVATILNLVLARRWQIEFGSDFGGHPVQGISPAKGVSDGITAI